MRFSHVLSAMLLAVSVGIPAQAGLIITPIWDTSISGDVNAAAIEGTINQAITLFQNTYTNPINVKIDFYKIASGGSSETAKDTAQNYQAYYNALVATNANPAAIAGLTANGGNAANNPATNTATITVATADLRAVGLAGAADCNVIGTAPDLECDSGDTTPGVDSVDSIVGLDTSLAGANLLSITEHEIDEALGLGSALDNCDPAAATPCTSVSASTDLWPEDLYSYTAAGVFAFNAIDGSNCNALPQAYLSYSGAVVLTNLNTVCNGGDFGDWVVHTPAQVQDFSGGAATYGANEIAGMTAIGYTLAPEPATWTLLLSSLGVLAFVRRKAATKLS